MPFADQNAAAAVRHQSGPVVFVSQCSDPGPRTFNGNTSIHFEEGKPVIFNIFNNFQFLNLKKEKKIFKHFLNKCHEYFFKKI